jgi:hypothetical protein
MPTAGTHSLFLMVLLAALTILSVTASYVAPEAYPLAATGDPCYDYDFNPPE